MGKCGHEDDGGVGDEGLEDATVPAGHEAKNEAREENGGQCCCYFFNSNLSVKFQVKCKAQRKPFPKKREEAGSKDEQEPSNNRKVKDIRIEQS